MTAGCPALRFRLLQRAALHAAPPDDDGPDLDDVVVGQAFVVRGERVVADHQHRLGHDVEVASGAAATFGGAGTSSSRFGFRRTTFMRRSG